MNTVRYRTVGRYRRYRRYGRTGNAQCSNGAAVPGCLVTGSISDVKPNHVTVVFSTVLTFSDVILVLEYNAGQLLGIHLGRHTGAAPHSPCHTV